MAVLVNQVSSAPTRKVWFAGLGGVIGGTLGFALTAAGADGVLQWIWGPGVFGFTPMPDEIASSLITMVTTTVSAFGGGYFAHSRSDE